MQMVESIILLLPSIFINKTTMNGVNMQIELIDVRTMEVLVGNLMIP